MSTSSFFMSIIISSFFVCMCIAVRLVAELFAFSITAAPIIPVLIPFIVDVAMGDNPDEDIVIRRIPGEGLPLYAKYVYKTVLFMIIFFYYCSCFLSTKGAVWGAFLVPVFIILLFNLVIYVCVIVVILRHAKRKASLKSEAVEKKNIVRLMLSISGVMFLFGLTWLFAILMNITPVPEISYTFQTLFTVFNSLQGVFIFLFICVISADARNEWKRVFEFKKIKSLYTELSSSKTTITKSTEMSETFRTNVITNNYQEGKLLIINE